jgi:hypothetical protein
MKEFLGLLAYVIVATAIGALLAVGLRSAIAWHHGGSPDPRCVYGWRGYVEVHVLDSPDRVSCQYRPDVGAK